MALSHSPRPPLLEHRDVISLHLDVTSFLWFAKANPYLHYPELELTRSLHGRVTEERVRHSRVPSEPGTTYSIHRTCKLVFLSGSLHINNVFLLVVPSKSRKAELTVDDVFTPVQVPYTIYCSAQSASMATICTRTPPSRRATLGRSGAKIWKCRSDMRRKCGSRRPPSLQPQPPPSPARRATFRTIAFTSKSQPFKSFLARPRNISRVIYPRRRTSLALRDR